MQRTLEAELGKGRAGAGEHQAAVRLDKAVVPLLEMLDEASGKVERLRAELRTKPKTKAIGKVLPSVAEKYARDLRATLSPGRDRARLMLSRFLK